MFFSSFKFDENIKSKLPEMINNLKTKLFDVPIGRQGLNDEGYDQIYFGWVVDFSPDNVINTALRKEELMDFALFNDERQNRRIVAYFQLFLDFFQIYLSKTVQNQQK